MADAKGLQELIGYFEVGDKPTGDQFSALINSTLKCINGTFSETDIDDDGDLLIAYPASDVDGSSVDTEIARPLYAVIYPGGDLTVTMGMFMVQVITTKSAKIQIGSKLPTATYYWTLMYQF
jgi:hypothetical protein